MKTPKGENCLSAFRQWIFLGSCFPLVDGFSIRDTCVLRLKRKERFLEPVLNKM